MSKTASTSRIRNEAADYPVPQNREQAADLIAQVGQHQRERARIEAAMNDELAEIRQRYEAEAQPHADAIRAISQGVQVWAEANRETLTRGKTKTVRLASGELNWRTRPPRVVVRGVEAVLDAFRQLSLTRFIRIKEEVNKEAVLADPAAVAAIKGVSINQGEDFVIKPFETELEEVA